MEDQSQGYRSLLLEQPQATLGRDRAGPAVPESLGSPVSSLPGIQLSCSPFMVAGKGWESTGVNVSGAISAPCV